MSTSCRSPKSILEDKVGGRVPFGTKSGPPKFLTDEEKKELVNFLCNCAAVGYAEVCYAKSKQEILTIVRSIVESKGI